jgi:hypothetical protein
MALKRPMNPNITLLAASFSLMMNALSAQSASPNIKITYLPFNITAPGTYVLTGNMTGIPVVEPVGTESLGVINIATNIPGPVIVDLKGFTITSGDGGISSNDELETCIDIGGLTPGVTNLYPITIRNGTIKVWGFGVVAGVGSFTHPVYLSNITIQNVVFGPSIDQSSSIQFFMVNSSTINNCTFDTDYGVFDDYSLGGNSYSNDTFDTRHGIIDFGIAEAGHPAEIQRLVFSPPGQN